MLCSFLELRECSGLLSIPNSKHRQFCPLIEDGKEDNNFLLMRLAQQPKNMGSRYYFKLPKIEHLKKPKQQNC